ncbi:MAG: DUF2752 domain-containing protein [Planctomycetes bacterium]|nr:DUF2752 domain-containing protein [Planctomycetota bacterium]
MERASPRERKLGLLLFLLVAGGIAGLFLCETVLGFDVGRLFNPCGFKQRTHLPCITCGWTTSTLALVRGDIGQAFTLQPAATFVNMVIVGAALTGLWLAATGKIPRFAARLYRDLRWRHLLIALVVILLGGWSVTLARALSERSG